MGILNDGINGGFRGKAGSYYGYKMKGQWIIRGKPKLTQKNKIGSTAQKTCRSRFAKMQEFLKPLIYFIRVGFNLEAKDTPKSAHNVAKSYNMLHAFNAQEEIDCNKIVLAFGKLAAPINAAVTTNEVGLHFTWTCDKNEVDVLASDQVMLVAYCIPEERAYFMNSGARRTAEMENLEIPVFKKGSVFHTWIAFIADDRESISMSCYVGEVVF